MYLPRLLESEVNHSLERNSATAILGPRQCGKSTLARHILSRFPDVLYLDLELPSDLQKLEDAEWFLSSQKERLVCLDEIQRKPELFPILRSLIDNTGRPGMYLILGSASRDLIKQSSESLAGRISYKRLTPFLWREVRQYTTIEKYLSRGGFPPSLLSKLDKDSFQWRRDFSQTFLERDLLQFSGFTSATMRRLWQMLAHHNGQTVNYSRLGESLGVSHTTIRRYIDLLESTFMLIQLPPYSGNTMKRLVKSPKIYLSDTGMTNVLLNLRNFEQAAGHPVFGSLWEAMVLTNLKGHYPSLEYSFYRSTRDAEVDIVLTDGKKVLAVECKASMSPDLTRGNFTALEDVKPAYTFVAAPVEESYPVRESVDVVSLDTLISRIGEMVDVGY